MSRKVPPSKSLFSKEYDAFLRLLREAREEAGLTQAEAAKRLKRPQSFVSKCESGERRVDVVELIAICDAYGISVVTLIQEFGRRLKASGIGSKPLCLAF